MPKLRTEYKYSALVTEGNCRPSPSEKQSNGRVISLLFWAHFLALHQALCLPNCRRPFSYPRCIMRRAMKRTLNAAFAVTTAALSSQESCPCFTSEQYDKIFSSYPDFGCHFTGDSHNDVETLSSGIAYLWLGHLPIAVFQASVTVEDKDGNHVEGGICSVGAMGTADIQVENTEIADYGDGLLSPDAFEDCVHIMRSKCEARCDSLHTFDGGREGCGHLPFAVN